ncbi:MAG: outer membrane beta-barrel protein, partial [Dongiaceae bacterium]
MRVSTALAVIAAGVIVATVPLTAAAAGLTIGGNIGSARLDSGDFEGDDTGWKAHVGSSFGEIIGGEIGYIDFGRYQLDPNSEGSDADAWTLGVTLGVPVGLANVYAKGGVAAAEIEGSSVREEYKNNDPFYGVGLRIGMTPGLGFRAEYERYQFDNADLDMAMAGLEFRFGERRP